MLLQMMPGAAASSQWLFPTGWELQKVGGVGVCLGLVLVTHDKGALEAGKE